MTDRDAGYGRACRDAAVRYQADPTPGNRADYYAAYSAYNRQVDLEHDRFVFYFAGGTFLASLAVGGYLVFKYII